MEILANIFLIGLICTLVIDVLRFPENIQPALSTLLGFKVKIGKPFNCSTCSTWWIGLVYLIIVRGLSIGNVALCLCVAASTPLIETLWWNVQEVIGTIINLIRFRYD